MLKSVLNHYNPMRFILHNEVIYSRLYTIDFDGYVAVKIYTGYAAIYIFLWQPHGMLNSYKFIDKASNKLRVV